MLHAWLVPVGTFIWRGKVCDTTAFTSPLILQSMQHGTREQTKYLQMTTDVTHVSHETSLEINSKAAESESPSVLLQKRIAPSAYNRVNRRVAPFAYSFNYGKFYEQWSFMVHNNTYFDIIQIVQN
jgi:hypothetical protein